MSNATGMVWASIEDSDAERDPLGYFIYFGSSSSACTRIFPTSEAAWDANRTPEAYAECGCGEPSIPVVLESTYGGGFWWYSKACLKCNAITGCRSQYEHERETRKQYWWGEF